MSATSQGGVSVIAGANHGSLVPVSLASGATLTFTHGLGRRAYQVLVTDGVNGRLMTNAEMTVTQATVNAVSVQNATGGVLTIYVAIRWENLTAELDLIAATDSRVSIEEG